MSKTKFDFKVIKSFEDACKHANVKPEQVYSESDTADEKAYKKLKLIFKVINEGWEPNWHNSSQYKYWPWFEVEASEELSSGFGFSHSGYGYSSTHAGAGSRLCTDTSEKALFIAKQFQSEYIDYLLIT